MSQHQAHQMRMSDEEKEDQMDEEADQSDEVKEVQSDEGVKKTSKHGVVYSHYFDPLNNLFHSNNNVERMWSVMLFGLHRNKWAKSTSLPIC